MKVKELRVGNWVEYYGICYQITSIDVDSDINGEYKIFFERDRSRGSEFFKSGAGLSNEIFPVKITDNILNSNFELENGVYFPDKENKVFCIELLDKSMCMLKNYVDNECKVNIPFRYVHEFQNLWMDIVKEDLKINL